LRFSLTALNEVPSRAASAYEGNASCTLRKCRFEKTVDAEVRKGRRRLHLLPNRLDVDRPEKRLSEQIITAGASCSKRRRGVWRLCCIPKFPYPGCGVDLGNKRADGALEDDDFRMRGQADSGKQCLHSFG